MGSSSSSTAAAAAAATGPSNPNNPYHQQHSYHHQAQQYYNSRGGGGSGGEYQQSGQGNRYFDEYCYGGEGRGGYSGQQQQQSGGGMQASGSNRDLFHQQQSSSHQQHHNVQQQQPSSSSKHEKKKKWWKRRSSRSSDPGQPLRELLANWSLGEVVALVHEYETMTNEKELYIHAESARPRAPTLRSDLADLLDFKWNSDVNLVLPPAIFPAHRAILSQRSKYFRNLLNSSVNNPSVASSSSNGIVNVNVEDTSVDIPTFSSLLRYLYTEEVPSGGGGNEREHQHHHHHHGQHGGNGGQQSCGSGRGSGGGGSEGGHSGSYHALGTIVRPSKPLESDLRDLLQTGKYSDIVLVLGDEQFAVHKPILAARSPFFRSLLQRRSNSKKIVLDDTVIPKRYARVILNCMYTDKLDLSLIEPSRSGLSEVESLTFTGKVNPSGFEEAMELYQIGRFLEFDHLCISSEDIITESLTHDSLPQILRWSSQSHGSSWVRRQAIMYVQEEYASLISTPSFLELDKTTLLEVVQSDFLQASEVEVLNSTVKWGEHQLIKRVEDREPNLVSSTRDSVFRNETRKGQGKRNRNEKPHAYASDMHLNDGELREIVFELIRCVRVDHIGLSNESLVTAVRRGLVSIPPTHMITEEKVNPWVNNLQCPNYIRPRLYTPYYEEAKSALRQRTGNNPSECLGSGALSYTTHSSNLAYLNSIGRIKTLRPIIPDTLYMIDNSEGEPTRGAGGSEKYAGAHGHHHHHHHHHHHVEKEERKKEEEEKGGAEEVVGEEGDKGGDGDKGGGVEEMVVDQELLNAMLYREKKLRSAHLRNLSNPISRERATRYIRLRVVREFGYPDYVAELLDHHNRSTLNSSIPTTTAPPHTQSSTTTTQSKQEKSYDPPPQQQQPPPQSQPQGTQSQPPDCTPSSTRSPVHSQYNGPPPPPEFHTNMPDVAMTTDANTQQQVPESVLIPFLDLDLGDNSGGVVLGNERTGLVRSRNRSFGSLSNSRGSASGGIVCSSTQSLASRLGSSGNVAASSSSSSHHHGNAQGQWVSVASSSGGGGSAAAVGLVGTYPTNTHHTPHTHYATPHHPRTLYTTTPLSTYPHAYSIYSTTSRPQPTNHHHPHNPQPPPQQQPQYPQCSSYSQSLHRLPTSQQPPQNPTLLRSSIQIKNNTHNTPPSHYL